VFFVSFVFFVLQFRSETQGETDAYM
jgi:hypothetical protein